MSSLDPMDRWQRVQVSQQPGVERRERVVRDLVAEDYQRMYWVSRLIWLFASVLLALIGLRVLLKLIAANPANGFAQLVYRLSEPFVAIFQGLTITPAAGGVVLEIPSLIAMFVYALLAWGLDRLMWLAFYRPSSRVVSDEVIEHEPE